jgi:hypothetical protein
MTEAESSGGTTHEDLSIEEYSIRQENRRKNKILDFGFSAMIWILIFAVVLIILDLIAQAFNLESNHIDSCFKLLEYIVTAVLGFIFGRKSNE